MHTLKTTAFLCCLQLCRLQAATFYVDPATGNINNSGAYDTPWSTLEEVISHKLIRSYAYSPLPYNAATSQPVLFNASAPVRSGDTIVLRSGLHGEVFLQNYINTDYITIMAEAGHTPILKKIRLQACKYWRFEGLSVSSEPYGIYLSDKLVFFESHGWQGPTSHIEIKGCDVYSTQTPWTTAGEWVSKVSDGIYIRGDSVIAVDNLLRNVDMGLTAYGDHIQAIGNRIVNFSGDGMRLLGSYILFEKNLIKNCYDVDDNHDDGIQSFTTNGIVVDNNIVRSNIILNYDDPAQPLLGPLQGIGCFDGFYNNWLVENNLIVVNHWHGITFLGANDCRIINNTVLDPTPDIQPGASWIRIDNHKDGTPSSNCVVMNNVCNSFVVDGTTGNNVVLKTYAEYANNFVDYASYDFHLLENSVLIGAADNSVAPLFDLDGTMRPQGDLADIGCYEYVYTTGIGDSPQSDQSLRLFPNPAADRLQIGDAGFDDPAEVEIFTSTGVIVYRKSLRYGETELDISGLDRGMYFLTLIWRGERVAGKFIKDAGR
ncbi:MAG: right-handed parallel beta-helix repeat-containing protein [Lewinellaceae bacterium]|nr:right-handed parallel beta-helix repeat-containing protein [Lewinellaceae bacterium]